MEDAAAERVISEDNSSAEVDPDPMCLTSFGDDSGSPTLPCSRDDALVDKGAAAQNPCLPSMEIHTLTAAVAYFPLAQRLQRRGPSFTNYFFGSARPKR